MTPAEKGGGKGGGGKPRADQTQEYELGDDFLAHIDEEDVDPEDLEDEDFDEEDLDDEDLVEEDFDEDLEDEELAAEELDDEELEDEEAEDEELSDEDELEEVVSAETQEWDGLEAAEAEADEPAVVASATQRVKRAGSAITSGFQKVEQTAGPKITSGFAAIRRHVGFPIWLRFLTASVVIILSIAAATSASLILYLSDIANALKHGNVLQGIQPFLNTPGSGPQTIMILGSDHRSNGVSGPGGNSDTMMLLRLDPNRNAIALLSIPRDLKVNIPGHGVNKINAAYALGGPKLSLQTVKSVTGLQVNHIVNVDFKGFVLAVNAIGCVYVDVDRRYYHSNAGLAPSQGYSEINIQPGYQALCGINALAFARYRHTDTDIVRGARQQAFLREARAKVPPIKLYEEHTKLIHIFTHYTSSDINSADQMIQLLRLLYNLQGAQVHQVHFISTVGPSFVTATPDQVHAAVDEFLGVQGAPGPISSAAPTGPRRRHAASSRRHSSPRPSSGQSNSLIPTLAHSVVPTSAGRQYTRGIAAAHQAMPVFYPTVLAAGSQFAQPPRVYQINGTGDGSPPNNQQRRAYKWVFQLPGLGDYWGFEGTSWLNPPILNNPSETKSIGGRDYKLYFDSSRLRMVAWQTPQGSFWVSNSLIETIPNADMLKIAEGFRQLPGT